MEVLFRDLKHAARTLLDSPAFTAIAVLTLALGIGANTAIFTVLDGVLLRALPVRDAQQLVLLSNPDWHGVHGAQESGDRGFFAYHEFEYLRDNNAVFSGMFAADSRGITQPTEVEGIEGGTRPARISLVSGAYFSVLGVNARFGRVFTTEVDRLRDGAPVAVISHRYWKTRLAADPQVLGRKLVIGQTPFEIIGVAPAGFFGETVGFAPDIWVPLTMQAAVYRGDDLLSPPKDFRYKYMWLMVMARLKPGVTLEEAKSAINVNLQQMLQSEAGNQMSDDRLRDFLNQRIALVDGSQGASALHGVFGEPLVIAMGLVGLVLLIACANVANLLLARSATRQQEFAVRVALGAGKRRLVQQLLVESVLLALVGGGAGLLLAQWGAELLVRIASTDSSPIPLDLHPGWRILGFTSGVALVTGLLFGLAPALGATRVDLNAVLKTGTKGVARGHGLSAGRALVAGQVALSLSLLIVAGLFVHSLQKLARVKPGFDGDRLLQFEVSPVTAGYKGAAITELEKRLLDRIQATPGVTNASLSFNGLFNDSWMETTIHSIQGYAAVPDECSHPWYDTVAPDFFSTAGVPVLMGRALESRDQGVEPRAAVINQAMARACFRDENPIGRRISADEDHPFDFVVVGVVGDWRHASLWGNVQPWFYIPFFNPKQEPVRAVYEVRVTGAVPAATAAIRAAVSEEAPGLSPLEVDRVDELVDESLTTERMITQLATFFGLLALGLACIGLYGVMSYNVAGRRAEIGIRIAIGANRRDVVWLVLREAMITVVIGVAIGIPAVLAASRLLSSMLYGGLAAADPISIAAATGVLAAVAAIAGYLPARRASRADPMAALRDE